MAEEQRPEEKLNVFISYSRDDLQVADQLDATLTLGGFTSTIDRQGISGGEDWKRRLGAMIRAADTIVFVLTPKSANSDICRWEVGEAVQLGKRIMPVVPRALDGASSPRELAKLNYIYLYPDPKKPESGLRSGLIELAGALKIDVEWLREHTRYLQRASEWEVGGKPPNRLLSGDDIWGCARKGAICLLPAQWLTPRAPRWMPVALQEVAIAPTTCHRATSMSDSRRH